MMTPEEAIRLNRESYDAVAAAWDEARTTLGANERPFVERFLAMLDAPSHVLDLGCGTGRPMAEAIVAAGHRVTGVDQSEAQLALARARLPNERWIAADIASYAPLDVFDGAICWDALFHVPREHHASILARLHAALRPGAPLMLTAGGSAHPAFTDTMLGRSFFYDSHAPKALVALIARAGFEIVDAKYLNEPTGGRDKGRYAVVARRE